MFTPLLERQLKKYLKLETPVPLEWKELLNAVNRSYQHYERDHNLTKHAMEINSEELRQIAGELSDKEARLRAILEAASDGIIVTNERDEIEMCNRASATYLGFGKRHDFIGRNFSTFFPVLPQSGQLIEHNFKRDSQSSVPLEITASQINIGHQYLKIYVLRDVSNRKASEKKIALRHKVSKLLLQYNSLELYGPKILSILLMELEWDTAFFWLWDEQKQIFRIAFFDSVKNDDTSHSFMEQSSAKSIAPPSLETVIWKTKGKIGEKNDWMVERDPSKFHPISYISLPIFFESRSLGFIELYSEFYHPQDQELIKILQDISFEIGIAIAHQTARERELNLQKQLVEAARQAGMMQVASSVLHNIGNVLNSVNISAGILKEKFSNSELNQLPKVSQLLQDHKHDLASFLEKDVKGKHLPAFIIGMSKLWLKECAQTDKELEMLIQKIQHIKNIIKVQQSMSGVLGIKEKVMIQQLLDDLIAMHAKELENKNIKIKKDYDVDFEIITDRARLLQILVNLIRNAIEALESMPNEKTICVSCKAKQDHLEITVSDNGVGIAPEHMTEIFSYGFTTKTDGHGFGLHTSALTAKELDGELKAHSEGKERGATFKLTLPIQV
jgi:PAS domain S-box-containing protein